MWTLTKTTTSKCYKPRDWSHAAILFFRNFSCLSCLLLLEPLPQRLFRSRHVVSLANSNMSRVNIWNRLFLPLAQLHEYLFHVWYEYITIFFLMNCGPGCKAFVPPFHTCCINNNKSLNQAGIARVPYLISCLGLRTLVLKSCTFTPIAGASSKSCLPCSWTFRPIIAAKACLLMWVQQ